MPEQVGLEDLPSAVTGDGRPQREGPVKNLLERLRMLLTRRDDGASAVEYGLLVALIAVVIAGTVVALGTTLQNKFEDASCQVANQAACEPGEEPADE